jgi:hypothetical protein
MHPDDLHSSITDLVALYRAGVVMARPDEVTPWEHCRESRASWFRQAKAGEFDSFVRRLGRSYRLLLGPYLAWLSVDLDEPGGARAEAE